MMRHNVLDFQSRRAAREAECAEYDAHHRRIVAIFKMLAPIIARAQEFGVSLGRTRKMLAAIVEHTGMVEPSKRPTSTETKPPDTTAERRQITVLFSGLVGSTALSARIDAEDLREIFPPARSAVAELK